MIWLLLQCKITLNRCLNLFLSHNLLAHIVNLETRSTLVYHNEMYVNVMNDYTALLKIIQPLC